MMDLQGHEFRRRIHQKKETSSSSRKLTASGAFFDIVAIILGQEFIVVKPRTSSFRVLMGSWYILAIVFGTAYKGNLIAYMSQSKIPYRIEYLEELIAAGTT